MKKILIFGCKKTGKGLYWLLSKDLQNDVWLYDDNMTDCDEDLKNTGRLLSMFVVKDTIDTFDLVVFTPSIGRRNWLIQLALQHGITVLNEFEFCFLKCKAKTVCISGTDGKTTTTLMIESILKQAGVSFKVAGNIGYPISFCCEELTNKDILLAEVSSFMLEDSYNITPDIAVITNIAPDHIDWHKGFRNYCMAKSNLVRYLSNDALAIINADDENSSFLPWSTNAQVLRFSLRKKTEGAYLFDNALWICDKGITEKVFDVKDLRVLGEHNISNALCAVLVCRRLGISLKDIVEGLKNFKGVEHRLQMLFEFKKVSFINDSKATTVHATISAIKAFRDKNIGLIVGGRKKNEDFERLFNCENIKDVKNIAFFGESKYELFELAQKNNFKNCFIAEDLKGAVGSIFNSLKQKGGVLLFSPACASFDEYKNFEERGKDFCAIANDVKNENI